MTLLSRYFGIAESRGKSKGLSKRQIHNKGRHTSQTEYAPKNYTLDKKTTTVADRGNAYTIGMIVISNANSPV